jgi:hypothetical protein
MEIEPWGVIPNSTYSVVLEAAEMANDRVQIEKEVFSLLFY